MSQLFWEAWEYLQQGGWVMIPLGLSSLAMWVLILDRYTRYAEFTRGDIDSPAAMAVLAGHDVASAGSGLRRELLNRFMIERSGDTELDRSILHQHTLALRPRIRQHLAMIAILAAIAPLLGLLGTVLGMIETFQVISDFGTGNARALAGGISVALVTTQTGLLVAIPGLVLANRLRRRAEVLRARLVETTHMIDRDLARRGDERKRKQP